MISYCRGGHLEFPMFFHALADIHHTGAITFESFCSAVVSSTRSNDLAIWRNPGYDGPEITPHARAFLTARLQGSRAG